jgi:hypothetical protein
MQFFVVNTIAYDYQDDKVRCLLKKIRKPAEKNSTGFV